MSRLLLAAIRGYRYLLSPWWGGQCRFTPTCSSYALEAIDVHGSLRGVWLTVCRFVRCRPFGPSGYDPVPEGKR